MQTMYMLYTRDSLCNNVDISAVARIQYFDKPKRYLPRNISIVAMAITCKHYTCCIHVIAFATTLTFLHLQGFHILINQNASLPRNVSIVAKAITCKHYTCCIHVDMLCNNVDISTFARIPYFDKPKR